MSTKVYVVCHNDQTEKEVKQYCDYDVIRVSDTSPYFETQAFEILEERRAEWENMEYVGIITYSIFKKFDYKLDMQTFLERCVHQKADVNPIVNINFVKPRTKQMVSFIESVSFQHGTFAWHILYTLLRNIGGYTNDQIFNTPMLGFISNWWVAKPEWMMRYIKFVKTCIKYIDSEPSLSKMINEKSYYLGSNTLTEMQLMKIFKVPYYTLHPFIFERLPVLFFYLENARIQESNHLIYFALND